MRFLQIAKVKTHCTPNYLQNFTLAGVEFSPLRLTALSLQSLAALT